jgi:hypothetical protein
MATTTKVLFRGAATTTIGTTLYTVPSSTTTIVTSIGITNTAATAATYTLGLAGTNFATTVSIAPNDTIIIEPKQVLATTNVLTGGASATTVNFHICGVEIS